MKIRLTDYGFICDIWKNTTPRYTFTLIVYAVTILINSYVIGQTTKLLLNNLQLKNFNSFMVYILWGLMALAVSSIVSYYSRYSVYKQSEQIGESLYCSLFKKIIALPFSTVERYTTGDLESRLTYDVRSAIRIYRLDNSYIIGLLIGGIGNIIFIFLINWKIGLLAIAFGILGYAVNILFLKPIQRLTERISGQYGDMTDTLLEIIQGSTVIRIFHLQDWMNQKFECHNRDMRAIGMKLNNVGVLQGFINTVLGYMNTFVFLGVSLLFMRNGQVLFGDVMASFYYSQRVISLFTDISIAFTNLQNSYASIMRMETIKQEPFEEKDHEQRTVEKSTTEAIVFDNVTFSYQAGHKVLKNLSFTLQTNEILCIKGPSGAGKSTIFKLLLDLYTDWEGGIRIFGMDVRDLAPFTVRKMFSYIPQEPFFFYGTIFENIAIAKPDATLEEVESAARKANLQEFISTLPLGYQTNIGERGGLLSGGQRQRIAIARAFLKDAPILMLDEPLSAVDRLNAEAFYDTLGDWMNTKTILIISPRSDQQELNNRFANKVHILELS